MTAAKVVAALRLPRIPDYACCTSWVQLPVTPTLAAPVYDETELRRVAARLHDAVG